MIRRAATNRVLNVLRHWVSKHWQVGGIPGRCWGPRLREVRRQGAAGGRSQGCWPTISDHRGGDQGHSRARGFCLSGYKVSLHLPGPWPRPCLPGAASQATCLSPEGLWAPRVPCLEPVTRNEGHLHGQDWKPPPPPRPCGQLGPSSHSHHLSPQDFETNEELKCKVIGFLEEVMHDPELLTQERKAAANIIRWATHVRLGPAPLEQPGFGAAGP